uniref:Uncharacterized protein n=1 Tax=Aegilops tauschii subsp. strangulata TaxID=200361 RepID=A0A453MQ46_AEGTS
PEMTEPILNEYHTLWAWTARVELDHFKQDEVSWAWETSGSFSMRTAYAAKFWGREVTP